MSDDVRQAREAKAAFLEWVDGKPFEELQAFEHDGRVHFPHTLKRKNAKGHIEEVPVTLRVPRKPERIKARVEARAWCAKQGINPEHDVDIFDSLDTVCIAARAIRDAAPPHAQHKQYEDLVATYDDRSIIEAWDRLQVYERLMDPRPTALDDEIYRHLVHQLRKAGNLGPLVAIAGSAQDSFVLRMASDLSSCLTGKCSSRSPETSTSDSSPPKSDT